MPTGATVAALTTSLPETPGGERNWDYRYTWMRDSTFTLQALHWLNLDWEADEFMQFVADLEPNEDGALQIMYGIDGRRDLTESTRDDLSGYAGARPVRIGNGAFDQRQNDVFGAVLDSILLHTRRSQRLPRRLWPIVQTQAECATAGLARARPGHLGGARRAAALRLLEAHVLGRARPRRAARRDPRRPGAAGRRGAATADEIQADILAHGVSDEGVLRQHYETDALDASTLLAAIFGFLPGDDERLRATVRRDRRRPHRGRLRAALPHRRDRRRPVRQGGHVPDLLVLARLGARDRRRAAARARPDGAPAADRLAARPLRRGVRRRDRPAPRQLPAGVLAPRADRGGGADHPRRAAGGVLSDGHLRRHHHRHRRRRRHARPHLAPSGKRILLLERGDWLPREPENWSSHDVFVDNRYISADTWYDEDGKPFQPQVHYFVGGATKLYGAALYRLREQDFGELQHHDGISPAWPISYDELEPYYTQAEQLYQVHGARGEDPTEPPASAPYPFPAVSHEPRIQQLSDDLAAAGFHPFHAPCGIMLNEANMPYSDCVRCADCDGFPCLVHAKSDAEVLGVRPALEHPNVTLLTNAKAVRLETNAAGTAVTEVVVEHDGETERYAGDIVVVSCGAANSAKLLLARPTTSTRTASPTAPTRSGATTCSTTAGRARAVAGAEPDRLPEDPGLNDFYFGSDDFDYPMGNIQMVGKSQAQMFRARSRSRRSSRREWTLERMARHAVDFWLSTEDLPRPDNRVTLDRDGNVKLSYTETNASAEKRSTTSSSRCSAIWACTRTT